MCVIGETYPKLISELNSFRRLGELKAYPEQETDCFLYVRGELPEEALPWQKEIVAMLQEAPHSLTYLARAIGRDPETIDLTPLVESNVLARISVTPTDILHVQGRYNRWNRDLAQAGIEILAKRKGIPVYQFIKLVEQSIYAKMAMTCIQSVADFAGKGFDFIESKEAMYLIREAFGNQTKSLLQPRFFLNKPIVAIGAPAGAWVHQAGRLLNAEVIVPEHADVANALGAAVGQIVERVELLISLDSGRYILNTPWDRAVYKTKDEAMFYAVHEGRKHIEHCLRNSGCTSWNIAESLKDIMVEIKENEPTVYMGTEMIITGVGNAL